MVFLLHIVVSGAILFIVSRAVDGFLVENFPLAMLAALVLSVINAIIRPVMILLTLPLTIFTFGLFLFVINALMLKLAALLLPGVQVIGIWPAIIAALLLSILNTVVLRVPAIGRRSLNKAKK